jgi:hypothetical protein
MDDINDRYWERIEEGFAVIKNASDSSVAIINGLLVAQRQRMSRHDLKKWDDDYVRRLQLPRITATNEAESDLPEMCPAVRDSVLAPSSQATPLPTLPPEIPKHLPGLIRPPWHEGERQGMPWYWLLFTPPMWKAHHRWSHRIEPFVGKEVPFPNWRDFANYRIEWRAACCSSDRRLLIRLHFFQIRFGYVYRMFNTDRDLRCASVADLLMAAREQGKLSREGNVRTFIKAGREINPNRLFESDVADAILRPKTSPGDRRRELATAFAAGAMGDGYQIGKIRNIGEGTSWKSRKNNPRGAMWLTSFVGDDRSKADKIINALPNHMRQIFDLYFCGFKNDSNGQPLHEAQIAFLMAGGRDDPNTLNGIQKTLVRIRKRFRLHGLPDPLPQRQRNEYADTSYWTDLGTPAPNDSDIALKPKHLEGVDAKIVEAFNREREEQLARKRRENQVLRAFAGQKLKKMPPTHVYAQNGVSRFPQRDRPRNYRFRTKKRPSSL